VSHLTQVQSVTVIWKYEQGFTTWTEQSCYF